MNTADALRDWVERQVASEPKPGIRYLAAQAGHGDITRGVTQLAKELRVSRRAIERYVTEEKSRANYPAAQEARSPERSTIPRVREWYRRQREEPARDRVMYRLTRMEIKVHTLDGRVCYSTKCEQRHITALTALPRTGWDDGKLTDFVSHMENGDYGQAAPLFEELYFTGYDLPGAWLEDVDRLEMEASA